MPDKRAEMNLALADFHPAVQRWFAMRFTQVTGAQAHGWPAIRSGRDTLESLQPGLAR